MTEGNSLINVGDISKPVTVLIEKVSSALGVIFEPYQLKRMARAEVEIERIKTIAKYDLSELEGRAIERMIAQESRKQNNIESITFQAAEKIPPDANLQDLEEDWIAHLFKHCDTVSDKEMQSLWAKLLAGEASKPGTYSKRTINFIATMDKYEADLFTKFCSFLWNIGGPIPLIFNPKHEIYLSQDINFSSLKHLDSIGLISFDSTLGYQKKNLERYVRISYFSQPLILEFEANLNNLNVGMAILTNLGAELSTLCRSSKNEAYHQYVLTEWLGMNIATSCPLYPAILRQTS